MLQLHWHGAETNEASSKRKSASDKQDIFVDQDFSSLQYEKKIQSISMRGNKIKDI